MSAGVTYRGKHLIQPPGRSNVRVPTIDETVVLDFSLDTAANVASIIKSTLSADSSKAVRIGHLNNFVRLAVRFPTDVGVLKHNLFSWIRCLLCDQEREIRAAALRALRYSISGEEDVCLLVQLKLDLLIARCIDIVLDNHQERVQVLRLIAKAVSIDAKNVPSSLIRPLIAVAEEGLNERDKLTRAALAILCELTVKCSEAVLPCGSLSWLIRHLFSSTPLHVTEALVSVLAHLCDRPNTRLNTQIRCIFQELVAPLLDPHFRINVELSELSSDRLQSCSKASEESRECLSQCRLTLTAVLRSWPLILAFTMPISGHLSAFRAMVQALYLQHSDLQETVLNTLYDAFFITWKSEAFESRNSLLEFARCPANSQLFSLQQGYVCEEAKFLLPSLNSSRLNLMDQYFAFLLLCLVDAGLIQGLVHYATSVTCDRSGRKCIYLLAQLILKSKTSLPVIWCQNAFSFPSLIRIAGTYEEDDLKRDKVHVLVSHLEDVLHCLWQRQSRINAKSLALQTLLKRANVSGSNSHAISKSTLLMQSSSLHDLIKTSRVLLPYTSYSSWDWNAIQNILCYLKLNAKQSVEASSLKFLQGLVQFFRPISGSYHKLQEGYEQFTKCGCLLMDILGAAAPDSGVSSLTKDFANDLTTQLSADRLHIGMFSTRSIVTSAARDYFILIGQLSSTEHGKQALERVHTFQKLFDLINTDTDEIYVKLIVSNLDYGRPGVTRIILSKCLTSTKEGCRIYTTEFLRAIGRLSVTGYERWCFELLIGQLYDSSVNVLQSAMSVLDEFLQRPACIQALLDLKPSLLPLGDAGVLVATYLLSTPGGLKTMQHAVPEFAQQAVEQWKSIFNRRYVEIVEENIHEALSEYKRTQKGTFGRRSTSKRKLTELSVPPHLYGQLSNSLEGMELLNRLNCVTPLLDTLQNGLISTTEEILSMKSAIWASAHIASSDIGISAAGSALLPCIVKIAEECPVYSIKGHAYYAVGVIAQCPTGAQVLAELGWETPLVGSSVRLATAGIRNLRNLPQNQVSPLRANSYDNAYRERSFSAASMTPPNYRRRTDTLSIGSKSASPVSNCLTVSPVATGLLAKQNRFSLPRPSVVSDSEVLHLPDRQHMSVSRVCSTTLDNAGHGASSARHRQDSESGVSVFSCASCDLCRPGSTVSAYARDSLTRSGVSCPEGRDSRLNSVSVMCTTAWPTASVASTRIKTSYHYELEGDEAAVRNTRSMSLDAGSSNRAASVNQGVRSFLISSVGGRDTSAALASISQNIKATESTDENVFIAEETPTISRQPDIVPIAHPRSKSFGGLRTCHGSTSDQRFNGVHSCANHQQRIVTILGPDGLPIMSNSQLTTCEGVYRRLSGRSFLDDAVSVTSGFGSADSVCDPSAVGLATISSDQHQNACGSNQFYVTNLSPVLSSPFFGGSPTYQRQTTANCQPLRLRRLIVQRQKTLQTVQTLDTKLTGCRPSEAGTHIREKRALAESQQDVYYQVRALLQAVELFNQTEFLSNSFSQSCAIDGQEQDQRLNESVSGCRYVAPYCESDDRTETMWSAIRSEALIAQQSLEIPAFVKDTADLQELEETNLCFWYDLCQLEVPDATVCVPVDIHMLTAADLQHEYMLSFTDGSLRDVCGPDDISTPLLVSHGDSYCFKCCLDPREADAAEAANSSLWLVRKEILRLACLLHVRRKYAETGLLRLRQEYPGLFQSVCVYSDVCHLLSSYKFRLMARRFLQELFQDLNFPERAFSTLGRRILALIFSLFVSLAQVQSKELVFSDLKFLMIQF